MWLIAYLCNFFSVVDDKIIHMFDTIWKLYAWDVEKLAKIVMKVVRMLYTIVQDTENLLKFEAIIALIWDPTYCIISNWEQSAWQGRFNYADFVDQINRKSFVLFILFELLVEMLVNSLCGQNLISG